MKKIIVTVAVTAVLSFAGSAFAKDGQMVFNKNGCVACHVVAGKGGKVGPALDKIGEKGNAYIRESIVDTNKVIAKGYAPNIMPKDYGKKIPKEELDLLVDWLAKMK